MTRPRSFNYEQARFMRKQMGISVESIARFYRVSTTTVERAVSVGVKEKYALESDRNKHLIKIVKQQLKERE